MTRRWAILAAAGVGIRIALWIWDPHPLVYGDSGSYLSAALNPRPYIIHPKGVSLFWNLTGVGHIVLAQTALTVGLVWAVWDVSKKFWVAAVVALSPLTIAYERVLLSEHLFATLLAVGIALLLRRSFLAGFAFGCAAVTRSIGVGLAIPLAVELFRHRRALAAALALFALVLVVYVARYVYPTTRSAAVAFVGPNAISVVAPLAECPPAPFDICKWRSEHPNAIIFGAGGPVQARVKAAGWAAADRELRSIVFTAIRNDPVGYWRGYFGRIPHLFGLGFHYDHAGTDTVYGYSRQMLDRVEGPRVRPGRNAVRTRAWDVVVKVSTVLGSIVVVWGLLGRPPRPVWIVVALLTLGSIAFNDATARFLYPLVPLMLCFVRSPTELRMCFPRDTDRGFNGGMFEPRDQGEDRGQ